MTSRTFLNTSHQTIAWFGQQRALKCLELRPPFQRRPVWTEDLKSFLVDTVLRGYPMPEVYTFEMFSDDGEPLVAVVDGQQRIRALLEYMDDEFPIEFDLGKLEPIHSAEDTPWMHKRFSSLDEVEQRRFRNYKLIVRDLEAIDEPEIRHLFHRLNQSNLSLNSQELRYSIYDAGLLAFAETLTRRVEWGHFGVFTLAQRRRMLDTEFISELVVGYLHWPQNKKDNLDNYYRQYARVLPSQDRIFDAFDRTLRLLVELFPKTKMSGTRWYRRSDFYSLFLGLARQQIQANSVDELRRGLIEFSSLVSGGAESDLPSVNAYRDAVRRAASDRGRRTVRESALIEFLGRGAGPGLAPALDLVPALRADDDASLVLEPDPESAKEADEDEDGDEAGSAE